MVCLALGVVLHKYAENVCATQDDLHNKSIYGQLTILLYMHAQSANTHTLASIPINARYIWFIDIHLYVYLYLSMVAWFSARVYSIVYTQHAMELGCVLCEWDENDWYAFPVYIVTALKHCALDAKTYIIQRSSAVRKINPR